MIAIQLGQLSSECPERSHTDWQWQSAKEIFSESLK